MKSIFFTVYRKDLTMPKSQNLFFNHTFYLFALLAIFASLQATNGHRTWLTAHTSNERSPNRFATIG